MTKDDYLKFRQAVIDAGKGDDIDWQQNVKPPTDPEDFALQAIYVICNSGMKNTVARGIYDRVRDALEAGKSARTGFKHPGKVGAIDRIWAARGDLYRGFLAQNTDEQRLEFCGALPWVGNITKYHLAKNFGVDCAKPDRHLERIAKHHKTTTHELCARLAGETGDRIATVDLVLWWASALGIINTRELGTA